MSEEMILQETDETDFSEDFEENEASVSDEETQGNLPEDMSESGAGQTKLSRRLSDLNMRLERYPESSTLYLLRGEYFAQQHQYHLAKEDFEQALVLASAALAESDWGFVEQSVLDRAMQGLKAVSRRIEI